MGQKTLAQLNTAILAILEDAGGTIFTDTTTALNESVRQLSIYSPWRNTRILTARDKSRYIDINSLDLVDVDYAVYPVLLKDSGTWLDDQDLDDNRRNVEWETDSLRMDITNVPTASSTDTLTGTVTFTAASTAITGSGTAFTSELRVGYYIQKSGGSTWYRVGSITSATALVLSKTVVTADDGADTASATKFWQSDVYLRCGEVHYVTAQTDFAGAIDSGVAGGYAAGCWSIHVDALGTGTIEKNTLFTIAGCDGLYRVTADATIGTNEVDIFIEPALREIAPENAVVTFKPSSLKPNEERLVTELSAAQLAINHVGKGRTEIENAITAIATVNSTVDLMTAAIELAITDMSTLITDIASMKTAVNADIVLADAEVDLAKADVAAARVAFLATETVIATEIAKILGQITLAITDLSTGRALVNTITTEGSAVSNYANYAIGQLNTAASYIRECAAYMQQGSNLANQHEAAASHDVNVAQGYLAVARGFESEWAQDLSRYADAASRELGIANGHLAQASGYIREINSRLSVANVISAYQRWGREKLGMVLSELRAMARPRSYQRYSTS